MIRIALIAGLLAGISHMVTADGSADQDHTPVTRCEGLPPQASIDVFSKAETAAICGEMIRILDGAAVVDVRVFSKAAYVLSRGGYEKGKYGQITRDLVDIIRLRGLYDQESRWYSTLDLICRVWQAFNGLISPAEIRAFLHAAGPRVAKSLSDDDLTTAIILLKRQHQQGDD